jgi:Gametolysin peptidase M11
MSHELGHNLGMGHSLNFSDNTIGDPTDPMGGGGHVMFNPAHQFQEGWLGASTLSLNSANLLLGQPLTLSLAATEAGDSNAVRILPDWCADK